MLCSRSVYLSLCPSIINIYGKCANGKYLLSRTLARMCERIWYLVIVTFGQMLDWYLAEL